MSAEQSFIFLGAIAYILILLADRERDLSRRAKPAASTADETVAHPRPNPLKRRGDARSGRAEGLSAGRTCANATDRLGRHS